MSNLFAGGYQAHAWIPHSSRLAVQLNAKRQNVNVYLNSRACIAQVSVAENLEAVQQLIVVGHTLIKLRGICQMLSLGSKMILPRQMLQLARFTIMDKLGRLKFDRLDFEVTRINVPIHNLGSIFDNYCVIHISDIHLGQWLSPTRLDGVVEMINDEKPDAIAITGDFLSFAADQFSSSLVRCLRNLRAKDAILAVLGNHDYWMGPAKIRNLLRQCGIIELGNEVYAVRRDGTSLYFAGVDDVMVHQDRLDEVLKKLPVGDPAILLVHEPDFADISSTTDRFSLQLSGHSHGGQLVLPRFGPLFRGAYFKKYPLGQYEVGDMTVYTSRGLGTNTIWTRINCAPEITVINLKGTD